MVRHRSTYSPAGRPGSSVAQSALELRIGHWRGRPCPSNPCVLAGIFPPGNSGPQSFGGGKMRASDHVAPAKCGSSAGQDSPTFWTQVWTLVNPDMPDCAHPVTAIGLPARASFATSSVAENDFSGLSTSLLPPRYVSFAYPRLLSTIRW